MNKKNYTPDRTLKNMGTIFRSKGNSTITLSCKKCPIGVSPKNKHYHLQLLLFLALLGLILHVVLYHPIISMLNIIVSDGCNGTTVKIISFSFQYLCMLLLAPIVVIISFYILKWVPILDEGHEKQTETH